MCVCVWVGGHMHAYNIISKGNVVTICIPLQKKKLDTVCILTFMYLFPIIHYVNYP